MRRLITISAITYFKLTIPFFIVYFMKTWVHAVGQDWTTTQTSWKFDFEILYLMKRFFLPQINDFWCQEMFPWYTDEKFLSHDFFVSTIIFFLLQEYFFGNSNLLLAARKTILVRIKNFFAARLKKCLVTTLRKHFFGDRKHFCEW